jgi:hypothetical protein
MAAVTDRPCFVGRGALVVGAALIALVLPLSAGAATQGPRVSGTASGILAANSRVSLRIDTAEVGGWQGLHELRASLLIGGQPAEVLSYDVENQQLSVGDQVVLAGTGGAVSGAYLQVSGDQVVVTTGGANLSLSVTAKAVQAIPPDARFRFEAVDDAGSTAGVTRPIGSPTGGGGVSWGTVIATVAVALLGGAFLGNLFASKRRPAPRLSVYSTIQRRIEDERRAQTPTP